MEKQYYHKLPRIFSLPVSVFFFIFCFGQAEHEIQVYASPTIQKRATIFELHTNYTFQGSKDLVEPKSARYLNLSLEVTHGFTENFELGFYAFTSLKPGGE